MNNIQVGDTVMVVRPTLCCSVPSEMYKVFKVEEIVVVDVSQHVVMCPYCGRVLTEANPIVVSNEKGSTRGSKKAYELPRLKKIEPLEDEMLREAEERRYTRRPRFNKMMLSKNPF